MNKMKKRAFTLVELLVVIAIVMILAAILIAAMLGAIERGRAARVITDIGNIKTAAMGFYVDTETLPCTKSGGQGQDPGFVRPITPSNCWPNEGGCASGCTNIPGWEGPYLERWPRPSPWHKWVGGGEYNWYRWRNYALPGTGTTCFLAGELTLELNGVVPPKTLEKIDRVLDDGDLDTGRLFVEGPDDAPERLRCVVVCR